jgi:hypothetical protein
VANSRSLSFFQEQFRSSAQMNRRCFGQTHEAGASLVIPKPARLRSVNDVEDLTQADTDAVQPELPGGDPPTPSRGAGRRSRLTLNQQREIARVYAETTATTAEIRQQFGVGESSLYRLLQKQGVPLRRQAVEAAGSKAVRSERNGINEPAVRTRMSISRAGSSALRARAARTDARKSNRAAGQFRIEFRAERVYEAADVRDALRQAEASDTVDIVEITRTS